MKYVGVIFQDRYSGEYEKESKVYVYGCKQDEVEIGDYAIVKALNKLSIVKIVELYDYNNYKGSVKYLRAVYKDSADKIFEEQEQKRIKMLKQIEIEVERAKELKQLEELKQYNEKLADLLKELEKED